MNNDDKIMSLLTIAEDQLLLNDQRMEAAEKRLQRQDQAFDRYLQRMADQYKGSVEDTCKMLSLWKLDSELEVFWP